MDNRKIFKEAQLFKLHDQRHRKHKSAQQARRSR